MLEWLGKLRNKERAAEQLCMDNILTGLNESKDWSILDSSESLSISLLLLSSFRIFTERSFLLPRFFPALYDSYSFIIHPCVKLSLLYSLMYFHSFFTVFTFSNWCMFLTWSTSMFTYNLIELHLIPKMLGSQNNNADQLSSQFVTSVQVIPAKIVSVDCICAIGLSIKR